ncbi:MAG: trypsin-like peptidase domain-containing protein [Cyanobacteria bacterium P01_F01_bin.143]
MSTQLQKKFFAVNRYFPLVPIFGVVATITIQAQPVLALKPAEIASKIKTFTVQINGEQTGTGTIIEKIGDTYKILTCWHVVAELGTYKIVTPDREIHQVTQITNFPRVDLAIVEFKSSNIYQITDFGNVEIATPGNNAYTAAYPEPFPGFPERSYTFLDVAIVSNQPKGERGYQLIYKNPTPPGGSGGGIFDSKARLIGVNGRQISEGETFNSFGAGIPLQVYLASRVNLITSLGQQKLDLQDYESVIAELDRAIARNRSLFDAYIERAKIYYQIGKYSKAIKDLDLVLKNNPQDARAYSYRGLNYSSLGKHEKAFEDHQQAISLNPDLDIVYANRGLSYLQQKTESTEHIKKAILDLTEAIRINPDYNLDSGNRNNTFRLARELYFELNDDLSFIETFTERRLENTGFLSLSELATNPVGESLVRLLEEDISSSIPRFMALEKQAETFRVLGDYLTSINYPQVALIVIEQSLQIADNPHQEAAALLSFGNTVRAIVKREQNKFSPQTIALDNIVNYDGSVEIALKPYQPPIVYYERAASLASSHLNSLKVQINHLSMLLDIHEFWENAISDMKQNLEVVNINDRSFQRRVDLGTLNLKSGLDRELNPQIANLTNLIRSQLNNLPTTRSGAFARINFAESLIRQDILNDDTARILNDAIQSGQQSSNLTVEVEATRYLGYFYEQTQRYSEAFQLTEKAIKLASISPTEYPEIPHTWNAQLGRILAQQNDRKSALAVYKESISGMSALRSDFSTTSFENIFLEYISLLLEENPTEEQLKEARDVSESLRNSELDSSGSEKKIYIGNIDQQAAIIYPIILEDRLEVILTVPGQPLQKYTTYITAKEINYKISELRRQTLTNPEFIGYFSRSRDNSQQQVIVQQSLDHSLKEKILPLAEEIYSWLIADAEPLFQENDIKTLVFVLDGPLSSIPMSLLYDLCLTHNYGKDCHDCTLIIKELEKLKKCNPGQKKNLKKIIYQIKD